jgi:hypothetical protein
LIGSRNITPKRSKKSTLMATGRSQRILPRPSDLLVQASLDHKQRLQ